jgi:tetratricopeptide (TPR) repeat protein
MTNTTEYKAAVERALESDRLHEAFRLLRVLAPADAWRVHGEIDRAEEDYGRMLDYVLSGAPDPDRANQHALLKSRLYGVLDSTLREACVAEMPTLYFNTLRYERRHPAESVGALLAQRAALPESTPRSEVDRLDDRIFNRVWVSLPLSGDDVEALRAAMAAGGNFGALMVAAVTMSALQYFDERALLLLLDAAAMTAADANRQVNVRAVVGAMLVMWCWPKRSNTPRIVHRIAALRDDADCRWTATVQMLMYQFIRARDSERINRKIHNEIIPDLMKLSPEIAKKLKGLDPDLSTAMEENPEWEELMNSSGLADKVRRLSEMQEEGADVMLASFSNLKMFPFFNDISHWFTPFDAGHSAVVALCGHVSATVGKVVSAMSTLCDSDKYSFVMSISALPESQRQGMMAQLEANADHMDEFSFSAELLPTDKQRESIAIHYIQDIYRFFRLFRRKGEFYDPFSSSLNFANLPQLHADFASEEQLRLVGEFYFKHEYFEDAITLFSRLKSPDASVWQKMGYAQQKTGHLHQALQAYENASLIDSDSIWTLRRIAAIHKHLGQPEKALEYYLQIDRLQPDDMTTTLNIGHCYMQLENYHEALHNYYKAEFIDETSSRPYRPIAWCAFLTKDFATARNYYERLLQTAPASEADYLNLGHLALATGQVREAMNYYKKYSTDENTLRQGVNEDLKLLAKVGVDVSALPFILDAIVYQKS